MNIEGMNIEDTKSEELNRKEVNSKEVNGEETNSEEVKGEGSYIEEISAGADIIICHNCGAQYIISERTCPYCGTENEELAQEIFEQEINVREDEILEEKRRPQKFVLAFRKKVKYIVLICLALIAVLVFTGMFKEINDPNTYEVTEEYIEELEQARIAHDYATVEDIVYDNQLYRGKYVGYVNLAEVYGDYEKHRENLDKAYEEMSSGTFFDESNRIMCVSIDIAWAIHYGLREIRSANEILAKDSFYGTEEDIELLNGEILEQFGKWGIGDDFIAELTEEMETDTDAVAHEDSLIWNKACEVAEEMFAEQ